MNAGRKQWKKGNVGGWERWSNARARRCSERQAQTPPTMGMMMMMMMMMMGGTIVSFHAASSTFFQARRCTTTKSMVLHREISLGDYLAGYGSPTCLAHGLYPRFVRERDVAGLQGVKRTSFPRFKGGVVSAHRTRPQVMLLLLLLLLTSGHQDELCHQTPADGPKGLSHFSGCWGRWETATQSRRLAHHPDRIPLLLATVLDRVKPVSFILGLY